MHHMNFKRILSALLAVLMVVGGCPASLFAVSADEPASAVSYIEGKTADPQTINGWKDFLKVDESTEMAGSIWTDKSVFAGGKEYNDALPGGEKIGEAKAAVGDENFLVSLSAITSNKSITGYDTIPTDTVFMLDMSSSMYKRTVKNQDGKLEEFVVDKVQDMVNAVNSAIASLQSLNQHNRVGVVLFFGGGDCESASSNGNSYVKLLDIDRYTQTDNKFLTVGAYNYWDGKETKQALKLSVNSGVKNSKGITQSASHDTKTHSIAGTYTQLGIAKAAEMLLAADTTVPSTADQQAGQPRIPIFVLLSDGEPTAATNDYGNIGTAQMGNNTIAIRNPVETDFVTQLTAALSKEKVDRHYVETTPLFYTLSFNIDGNSTSDDVMKPAEANTIKKVNKANTDHENVKITEGIKSYWQTLLNTGETTFKVDKYDPYCAYEGEEELTVKPANPTVDGQSFTFPTSIDQQNYVDKAFTATNAGELKDAFGDIVEEIKLQSLYSPTFVEGNGRELSGYVEFHDTIGDYMEVKDIKGIQLGSTLHTGAEFARVLSGKGDKGDAEAKEMTDKLVDSIISRLDLKNTDASTAKAQAADLVQKAKEKEQISYNEETGEWSNYAGWYTDAAGNTLGFWDGSDPEQDKNRPQDAAYTVKGYGYLGDYHSATDPDATEKYKSNLLYVSVQVRTEIATGKQEVVWRIPSALLPIITYQVELNGVTVESGVKKVEVKSDTPMRLLYEVGLRKDLDPFVLESQLSEEYKSANAVKDQAGNAIEGGGYYFYTNHWDANKLDTSQTADKANTYSSFEPSRQNEQFYFAFDTKIYSDDQGNAYTGSTPTKGYWKKDVFVCENGEWGYKPQYIEINSEALKKATTYNNSTEWYIPRGTQLRYYDDNYSYNTKKKEGDKTTGTVEWSKKLTSLNAEHGGIVQSEMLLGNNGRITMKPAAGLAITKTVDSTISENDTTAYKFTITPKGQNITLNGKKYETRLYTGEETTGTCELGEVTADNNTLTVTLQAGKTLQIGGLPAGSYTVAEDIPNGASYEVSAIDGDPVAYGVNSTEVTVGQSGFTSVSFENTADLTGWLSITKTVEHQLGEGYTVPDNKTFPITVKLSFAEGVTHISEVKVKSTRDKEGAEPATLKLGNDKSFSWDIHHNETISVELPNGTAATVTEEAPAGFTASYSSSNTVTVERGTDPEIAIINTYSPTPLTKAETQNVTLIGTKELEGREWKDGDSFTFRLERFVPAQDGQGTGDWEEIGAAVSDTNRNFDLTGALRADLQDLGVGTYSYQITEAEGDLGGVTYTKEVRSFTVTITDKDMDGKVEIDGITAGANDNRTTVDKRTEDNTTSYAIEVKFVNSYAPVGSAAVDVKVQKTVEDPAGTRFSPEGFQFGLYDATAKEPFITKTTEVDGVANFTIVYESTKSENFFQVEEGEDPVTQRVFTYYLKEIIPDPKVPGVTYDDQVYTVYVTVTDNQDGTLSAVPELVQGMQPARHETGETQEKPDENPKGNDKTNDEKDNATGDKGLVVVPTTPGIGGNGTPDDGKFPLMPPADQPAVPQEGGGQSDPAPDPLADDEDDGDDVETVAADEVKEEVPAAIPSVTATFTNSYRPTEAKITLSGTKKLEGRDQNAGEFAFQLYEADEQWERQGEPLATASTQLQSNETFAFTVEQSYSEVDTHCYVLVEKDTGLGGITYATTEYHILVKVADDRDNGQLKATAQVLAPNQKDEVSGNEAAISGLDFTNGYEPKPVTARVNGKKTLKNGYLYANRFTFKLYEADTNYQPLEAAQPLTIGNSADGSFAFEVGSFVQTGSYYYILVEEDDGQTGITYDTTTYGVRVDVSDNLQGSLVAQVTITNLKTQESCQEAAFVNRRPGSTPKKTTPTAPPDPTPKDNPTTGAAAPWELLPLALGNAAAAGAALLRGRKRRRK